MAGAKGFLNPATRAFYVGVMETLDRAPARFLIGGAYALERYTGIERHTKDLDIFVRPGDAQAVLDLLREAGYSTEMTFSHWLGKAYRHDHFIDVIFGSGNGLCRVDDAWFNYGVSSEVLGRPALLCPVEEMIWSKAFIMERERFDGADVAHLLRARGPNLDWDRLLKRFGPHWPVLLSHLLLFRYMYPSDTDLIPHNLWQELLHRCLHSEDNDSRANRNHVCRGTLLSREQYLPDIQEWGYRDARQQPAGPMTDEEIRQWTEAIGS